MQEFSYSSDFGGVDEYGAKFTYEKKMEEKLAEKRDFMNKQERNQKILQFITLTALSALPYVGKIVGILTSISGAIEAFSDVKDYHVPVGSAVYFYSRIHDMEYGGQRMIVVDPKGKVVFSRQAGSLTDSNDQIIKRINLKIE